MAKRNNSLTDAGYDALMLGTLGVCAVTGAYIVQTDYPEFALVPGLMALGAIRKLQAGFTGSRKTTRRPSAFAQITEFVDWRMQPDPDGSAVVKFKERPVSEFLFREPSLLSAPVPESVLKNFIKAGVRREQKARTGERNQFERSGGIRIAKRVNINMAWSRQYFTKTHRPRLLTSTYNDCVMILVVTGYMEPPELGKAPRLINWQVGEWGLYNGVQNWWLWLQANKPKAPSRNRLLKLLTFTN